MAMLIGANVREAQVHEECRRGGSGEPCAVRTVLGWAVLGPVDAANIMCSQPKNVNFVKYSDELADQQMKQFLRLEDMDMNRRSKKGMSIEDQGALKRMENSVCVVGGHYEVGMLWKSDTPWLPNNNQADGRSKTTVFKKENSSVKRTFTGSIKSLWRTSYRKDMPER